MVPMNIIVSLPDARRHHFDSSFETLLDPHLWRFTVRYFVDEILRTTAVDISAFLDDICAISDIASGFSLHHNRQGRVQLFLRIPAMPGHTGDSEAQDNQARINMAMELSFHESLNRRQGFGTVPTTRNAIEELDTFIVRERKDDDKHKDGAVGDINCAVCWEDIVPGDEASATPCSHVYHGSCIRRWLEVRRVCPLCRFALE